MGLDNNAKAGRRSEPTVFLELWVIYERPADYPHGYVVRRQRPEPGGRVWVDPIGFAYDTLEAARQAIPQGMINIGRTEGDPPAIREVWI